MLSDYVWAARYSTLDSFLVDRQSNLQASLACREFAKVRAGMLLYDSIAKWYLAHGARAEYSSVVEAGCRLRASASALAVQQEFAAAVSARAVLLGE